MQVRPVKLRARAVGQVPPWEFTPDDGAIERVASPAQARPREPEGRRIATPNRGQGAFPHDDVTALALAPDGSVLVTAKALGAIQLWHVASGEMLVNAKIGRTVTAVTYAADGARIVTATNTGIQVWDREGLAKKKPAPSIKFDSTGGGVVAVFSRADALLQVDSFGHVVEHVLATGATRELAELEIAVATAALSPSGRWLARGDREVPRGAIALHDLERGELRWLEGHTYHPGGLAFDGDETLISCGDALIAWDVASGEMRFRIDEIQSASGAAIVAPRRWIVATSEEERELRAAAEHDDAAAAVYMDWLIERGRTRDAEAVRHFGLRTHVIIGSYDALRIYDLERRIRVAAVQGPHERIVATADGAVIAGADRAAAILYAEPVVSAGRASGHEADIRTIGVSNDGVVVTTAVDGARVWSHDDVWIVDGVVADGAPPSFTREGRFAFGWSVQEMWRIDLDACREAAPSADRRAAPPWVERATLPVSFNTVLGRSTRHLGDALLVGWEDGELWQLRFDAGAPLAAERFLEADGDGARRFVRALAFDAAADLVFLGDMLAGRRDRADGRLVFVRASTRERLFALDLGKYHPVHLASGEGVVVAIVSENSIAWSGSRLLVVRHDGTLVRALALVAEAREIWPIGGGRFAIVGDGLVGRMSADGTALALSNDGTFARTLVAEASPRAIRVSVADVTKLDLAASRATRPHPLDDESLHVLAISPNGEWSAFARRDGTISRFRRRAGG